MAHAGSILRKLIDANRRISRYLDSLADRMVQRPSGMDEFTHRVVPGLLKPHLRVLDVGSGRAPILDPATIRKFDLHVTGLDICADELGHAPPDSYHETIVADLSRNPIPGCYDLILSRSVLEHVRDTRSALRHLTAALAPGGIMAHFIPCRNSTFARLNLLLGHRLSRRLLHAIYPNRVHLAGFPAYYHCCTPRQLTAACRACGVKIIGLVPYFRSDYLHFLVPLHALDLVRQLVVCHFCFSSLAETLILVVGSVSGVDGRTLPESESRSTLRGEPSGG